MDDWSLWGVLQWFSVTHFYRACEGQQHRLLSLSWFKFQKWWIHCNSIASSTLPAEQLCKLTLSLCTFARLNAAITSKFRHRWWCQQRFFWDVTEVHENHKCHCLLNGFNKPKQYKFKLAMSFYKCVTLVEFPFECMQSLVLLCLWWVRLWT